MTTSFPSDKLSQYQAWWDHHADSILDQYKQFLRFKTISAEAASQKEMRACFSFLREFVEHMGLTVEMWEGPHQPILFASLHRSDDYPTLLFYNHYDVQPVDPLNLWDHPPFEPFMKDNKIYARGASDNKGQCFYTLNGIKAFLETCKNPKVNIKLLIEGEEEVGSEGLHKVIHEKKEKLKADCLLLVDVDIPSIDEPAVTLGCRGIATVTFKCIGSNSDLHSGCFGGVAYNPLKAFSQVLSKCWDPTGRVTIDRFYDHVKKFNDNELIEFDFAPLLKEFDIHCHHHEIGYTMVQSNWTRPTLEINGLSGGYSGEGFKTVLPAQALLKLSARLVPDQDPEEVLEHIIDFFKKHMPKGLQLDVEKGHGGRAFRTPATAAFAQIIKSAYEEVLHRPCGFMLAGGSLPIATSLGEVSGAEILGIGYALPTDAIHAPNEHFGWDRFEKGLITIAILLEKASSSR